MDLTQAPNSNELEFTQSYDIKDEMNRINQMDEEKLVEI